jgi:hypothetical protein
MAGWGTAPGAAGADSNPYSAIGNRNMFHLNPAPPPPDPSSTKPVDLPKVMLTGFVGKGDDIRVLMAIASKDNKGSPTYLSLRPGERWGDEQDREVELVKIHLDSEEVEIINSGTPMTLSVKSNSYASASAPAPAHSGPGGPPAMRRQSPVPMPGMPPAAGPQTAAAQSGGSVIVAGGANYGSSSASVSGGATVSGGAEQSAPATTFGSSGAVQTAPSTAFVSGGAVQTAPAASTSARIANALFNAAPTQYRMPVSTAPPAALPVQAAGLLLSEKAGGPPAPPGLDDGN